MNDFDTFDLDNIPLFHGEEKSFTKVASTIELGNNTSNWDMEIVQHIHESHPYLTAEDTEMNWKKVDDEKGYGYGFVKVSDIAVPVIIKDYEMSPLDVFIKGGQAYPLTKDNIGEVLHTTDIGRAVPRPARDSLDALIYNRTYAPYDGKYVYANDRTKEYKNVSPRSYYSMLSNIQKDDADITEFRSKIASDQSFSGVMFANGMNDVLAASLNNAQANPVHAKMAEKKASSFTKVAAVVKEDITIGCKDACEFGKYAMARPSGEMVVGTVFPTVHNFEGDPLGYRFFNGDSVSSVMGKFAGVPYKEAPVLKEYSPVSGEDISFYLEGEDGVQVFEPVKLASKADKDGIKQFTVMRGFNDLVKVSFSNKVSEFMKISENHFAAPTSTKIMKVHPNVNLIESPDYVEKMAQHTVGVKNLTIRSDGHVFSFEGDTVKEAKWKDGVTPGEAVSFLNQWYTPESIKTCLKTAADRGLATIQDITDARFEEDTVKTASKKMTISPVDLTKEAEALEDQGLVDTVLSLKFINDSNVQQYISFIPQLEKAAGHLADLLLASRVGVNVEEAPVKTAMENVVKVVEDLKQLKGA